MIETTRKTADTDGPAAAAYITFIVLGIVFSTVAFVSGNAAFLPVGVSFLVIGVIQLSMGRRRQTPADD